MRANGGGADMTTISGTGAAGHEPVELAETVRRAKAGRASPQDVFDAFLRARVHCERPEDPGFLTVTAPGHTADDTQPRSRILDLASTMTDSAPAPARLLPVFTSLEQFARFTGGGAWFSTTGADVLDLLPAGLDVWLDPAAEHSVRLVTAATAVQPVLHVSYRPRRTVA